ncbi:heterokaryon incompatibility protein-domain-containing protein [Xylaria sp. FL1042]|nr:heterokaryon incompatibility protein-domain-containing protein [Xylaria sp. FL1042]
MKSIRDRLLGKKNGDASLEVPLELTKRQSHEISSFTDVRVSLNRSLSTRAHQLGRRVSSIRSSSPSLCVSCRQLDLSRAFQTLSNSTYNPSGILLGQLQDNPALSKCPLCQILSQVCRETCLAAQVPVDPYGPRLQLRAFYLLPHISEQWRQGRIRSIEHRTPDFFVAAVSGQFSMAPGGSDRAIFDDMVSKRGFLVYHDDKNPEDRILSPRLLPTYFDPCVVQNWLRVCLSQHTGCRTAQRPQPTLNLIDCRSQEVVKVDNISPDSELDYVALSYVWGTSVDVSKVVLDGSRLPQPLPSVVKDAIQVVLRLGYYYLWVDKYCIDKHDKGKKHEQLMHMDSVYKNAALTIVAAAGADESYGLPGVSRPRPTRQLSFKRDEDGYELMSTLPSPHSSIEKSRWATRGWTYQEAILSRRRLVFTDDQLYFECNSTSHAEGFDLSFDDNLFGSGSNHDSFLRPSLFSLKQLTPIKLGGKAARLSNLLTYIHCAEQYSKRTLSFDHDSLIAFSGIIRMLESITTFPVRHIWGIPFFHPDDDGLADDQLQATYQSFKLPPFWKSSVLEYNSAPKKLSPYAEGVDYLAYLMLGLCWRHSPSAKPPRRRTDLPSWSWTGWEGSLTWPKLTKDSDIRSSAWAETAISLGSNGSETVPELYHKSTDAHLLAQSNKSLHIRTSSISHKAFVFNESTCNLELSTGGEVRLYASKNDLDASKVFKRIQSERYEVIRLATVDEDIYMMLIKRYRNAYYRIGTMSVKDLYLTYSLFTSKIKTYKLR